MSIPYFEHFLDSLETLPADLHRNFNLMKDLDMRSQDQIKKINQQSTEYVAGTPEFSPVEKTQKFKDIQEMFDKTKGFADDKVQLAMQTYEMVDKHIRKLDSELVKLEADLKEKHSSSGSKAVEESSKLKRGRATDKVKGRGPGFNPKNVIKENDSKRSKKEPPVPAASLAVPGEHILASLAGSSEVLDMPVDPNEPTYCVCHQVSYGEMIGCDNADCPIEWFHFGCVGLTSKPKGKWFCPKCTTDRKKK